MRSIPVSLIGAVLLFGCSDDDASVADAGSTGGLSGGKAGGSSQLTAGASGTGRAGSGAIAGTVTTTTGATAGAATTSTGGTNNGGASAGIGGNSAVSGGSLGMGGDGASGGLAGTLSASGGSYAAGAAGGPASAGGVSGGAGRPPNVAGAAGAPPLGTAGAAGASGASGVAGTAGAAGTAGPWVPNPGCGAVRESVVGWWSFEETLTNHSELGQPVAPLSGVGPAVYTDGIAAGRALDFVTGPAVEATDGSFNVTGALTLSAFVKADATEGRIIDHITAGESDGFLLDFYQGRLRMIAGSRVVESTSTYSSFTNYTHVAGVFSGGSSPELLLFVDGALAGHATIPAGDIPTNGLSLRIGADSGGNNRFSGQIDEPMVIARALSGGEVVSLRDSLMAGQCPLPAIVSPANGLLLEHDDSGVAQLGSLEHVRSNIRRAGDLRVLAGDTLYSCDWNGMPVATVSSCQVWAPFATSPGTGDDFVPTVPLEWRLFKFNTTGFVDQIGTRIEAYGLTLHEQTRAKLSWFGRDWRTKRYAVDSSGTGVFGDIQSLAQQLRDGAGFGASVWSYSLPHFTAVVRRAGDHFAGLDPWHISTDSRGVPGEVMFQSSSYHYAVWFDTLGYNNASRWNFGSTSSISDSYATDATAYFTEPGWVEVLAHDAVGATTSGSKLVLLDAIRNGAAVRVESPESFLDCNRIQVGTDAICYSHDTYASVEQGDVHLGFDSNHARQLRTLSTNGQFRTQDWADHSASLLRSNDTTTALRWFVQSSGWSRVLQTNASGEVTAGSVADLDSAIRGGAEVMVARLGESLERVRCESLRIATNPTRAACLALLQFPGQSGDPLVPGYYEARVYNTSGSVATARVAFGSTGNDYQDKSTAALAWYVRRE